MKRARCGEAVVCSAAGTNEVAARKNGTDDMVEPIGSGGTTVATSGEPDSGYWRLEDQIGWYDRKTGKAQKWFKLLRSAQIITAALVPVTALIFRDEALIPGLLGALILILSGFQELGAYQRNWLKYRATCETLRHEKYFYLGRVGPYDGLDEDDAQKELVNRVEALVSEEHAQWSTYMESKRSEDAKDKAKEEGAG